MLLRTLPRHISQDDYYLQSVRVSDGYYFSIAVVELNNTGGAAGFFRIF